MTTTWAIIATCPWNQTLSCAYLSFKKKTELKIYSLFTHVSPLLSPPHLVTSYFLSLTQQPSPYPPPPPPPHLYTLPRLLAYLESRSPARPKRRVPLPHASCLHTLSFPQKNPCTHTSPLSHHQHHWNCSGAHIHISKKSKQANEEGRKRERSRLRVPSYLYRVL